MKYILAGMFAVFCMVRAAPACDECATDAERTECSRNGGDGWERPLPCGLNLYFTGCDRWRPCTEATFGGTLSSKAAYGAGWFDHPLLSHNNLLGLLYGAQVGHQAGMPRSDGTRQTGHALFWFANGFVL